MIHSVARSLHPRFIPLFVVLAAASGCGRGCGCVEGEKTYEVLEGRFRVEFVRNVVWTGGRIPGPLTDCAIRIHADPVRNVPVGCREVDLAQSPDGMLVAFRHDGTAEWSLLRLGRSDRVFFDCGAPLGRGSAPDWSRVEALPRAAPRILSCEEGRAGFPRQDSIARLAAELGETGGAGAVATFLADAAPATTAGGSSETWLEERARLPDHDRQAVDALLCGAFAQSTTAPSAFLLGARICPHDTAGASATALARLRAGLARLSVDAAEPDPVLEWSAIVALAGQGTAAAEAACAYLPRRPWDDRHDLGRLVIAAEGARCPAIHAELAEDPCRGDPTCGDAICTMAQLEPELGGWRNAPPSAGGVRPLRPPRPASGHTFLAALHAQGPLPADFVVTQGRRRYRIDFGSGPPCRERSALGAPCRCDDFVRESLCEAPAGASRWIYRSGNCSLGIDDERREIGDVRVACVPAGSSERCRFDTDCCLGLVCRPGSGDGLCIQPPPGDGGAGPP